MVTMGDEVVAMADDDAAGRDTAVAVCNIFNILILLKIYFFAVSSIQECFKRNLFL